MKWTPPTLDTPSPHEEWRPLQKKEKPANHPAWLSSLLPVELHLSAPSPVGVHPTVKELSNVSPWDSGWQGRWVQR